MRHLVIAAALALAQPAAADVNATGPCAVSGEELVCRTAAQVARGNRLAVKLNLAGADLRPARAVVHGQRGICGREEPIPGLPAMVYGNGVVLGGVVTGQPEDGRYCVQVRIPCPYGCANQFNPWNSTLVLEVR